MADNGDLITTMIQRAKDAFWEEHAELAPAEIQRRWSTRSAPWYTVMDAPSTSSPSIHINPTDLHQLQTTSLPGSIPSKGKRSSGSFDCPASTQPFHNTFNSEPLSRKRTSHSEHGPVPSTSNASPVPSLALQTWQFDNNAPYSTYVGNSMSPPSFKVRRTSAGRQHVQGLGDYSDIKVYEDPADYLSQSQVAPSPSFSAYGRLRRNSNQTPPPAVSPFSCSPMASASDDSSIPTPLTSFGMSREASLAGTSFCGGFDLMRVDSQTSDAQSFHDMHQEDRIHEPALTTYSKDGRLVTVPTSNLSLSVSYAGGMADSATWPSIQPAAEASQPSYGFENGLDMARSKSSDCRSSPSSRIVRRSQEQVVQAERPIAPKERSKGSEPTQPLLKSASEHGMIRQRSADGKKVSIPRVDHVRPKQPGLKCNLCNKKPDGYKGPHELRRHKETAHDKLSAYVCVDLSSDQKWLSECRACQSRHQYPQKHNAAAHLRRMHWHPKSKDRRTGVKSGESRGGKGGGREPPMAELQRWIQKISLPETGHESADKNINDDGDDDDDDESAAESDGDEDEIFVLDDIQASSSQTLDNGPSGPGANAALDNDSALSIDIDQNQNLALLGFWPHYDYFPQPTFDNNFDQYAGPPLYSSAPTIPHDTNADSMNSPPVDQTLATGTLGFNGLPFMPSMNSAFDRLSHFNALDPS